MSKRTNPDWPVLTTYRTDALRKVAMPIGGIGTGTVSLTGRGRLTDWEIVNRPAKGFRPNHTFFALWARGAGGEAVTRLLEGPLFDEEIENAWKYQHTAQNQGMPRFRQSEFHAAYPLGQVLLRDKNVPVDVRLEAFNPMAPADADLSGMPVAVLRYVLTNRTSRKVTASVVGAMTNFIGVDGRTDRTRFGEPDFGHLLKGNRNRFRDAGGVKGIFMDAPEVDPSAEAWGTMAMTTTARGGVTHRTQWDPTGWGSGILELWDDFRDDGKLDDRRWPQRNPIRRSALAVQCTLPPKASRAVTFLLTWHFPNRQTWTPAGGNCDGDRCPSDTIGNYYAGQYRDAWQVAERTARDLDKLETTTVSFARSFVGSDLPTSVKEAALNTVTALRSQTAFRTPDGRFYGFEGCCDHSGCCHGSCTHVWNYEHATAFLYGELARTMREVEFAHAVRENGMMSFRIHLPLDRAQEFGLAAADGQMGCLLKLYREWRLSGDEQMLRDLWPAARRALEFAWLPGGWDGDCDGVMEGVQHNTMDVEYYGPNPEVGVWYLGALRAAEEMAHQVGENDFADRCRRLFESGSAWMDVHLFNGRYYQQDLRPREDLSGVLAETRSDMGAQDSSSPDFQPGQACMADQLVGQLMAHVCGLGHLLSPVHIRKALRTIYRENFQTSLAGHFCHMRAYAFEDEGGMIAATYPDVERPERPFPYFDEVWPGMEYTAAAGMVYEGMADRAVKVVDTARARFDGRRRNPFDETECGHHYARSMSAWAVLVAMTGFRYSAPDAMMAFAASASPVTWFWASGDAWGTVRQRPGQRATKVTLRVLGGRLRLRTLAIDGTGESDLGKTRSLRAGAEVTVKVP